jgi:sugar lactone lactonase YvrE
MQMHKYSPTGAAIWSRQIHNGNGRADNVATDAAGNVFVIGNFGGLTDFNPHPSQTHYVTGSGGYILKLTASGDFSSVSLLLAKTSSYDLSWGDIGLDDGGNMIVAGDYRGQFDFDPSAQIDYRLPATTGVYAGFVAKFSASSLTWATSLGENSSARGVAVDQHKVYISGAFSDVFSPNGEISITSQGGSDIFVAQLSAAGVVQTAVGIGGTGSDTATAMVADGNGAIHVVGSFNETVDFNPDPVAVHAVTNPIKSDLFLLKLITPGFHIAPIEGLFTSESGATANFTVSLQSPPTADVFVPIESSNLTEATVSTSGLVFTPANWNVPQVVTVTGVDDGLIDSDVAYSIILGPVDSADAIYNGLDPDDPLATNLDNETPPTKFYVVDDASTNRTYEYGATGAAAENYTLGSGNNTPRGAASTAAGDNVWVVDANRKVYVYDASGGVLGSWTAGTLTSNATVEGIATNGTDVWIVDARSDKVFKYSGAASRTLGSQNAASSFSLNSGNRSPKDLVTDGTYLWVVNDSSTNKVFKYTVAGSLVGSWTINGANTTPTGITIDPANVSDIWIVDSGTDRVYQYTGAASRTSGSQVASSTFALAAGNSNPQGLADPPHSQPQSARPGSAAVLQVSHVVDLSLESWTAQHFSGRTHSARVVARARFSPPPSRFPQHQRDTEVLSGDSSRELRDELPTDDSRDRWARRVDDVFSLGILPATWAAVDEDR